MAQTGGSEVTSSTFSVLLKRLKSNVGSIDYGDEIDAGEREGIL